MSKYEEIKQNIHGQTLCIVSKKRSVDQIKAYYDLGERVFGENRAQELLLKAPQLPNDIKWQFIGQLQTNKVKQILPYVSCIQSLNRMELANEIEKQCAKLNKQMDVLVEFNLAEEATKSGLDKESAITFFNQLKNLPHLNVRGIMVIGPHVDDEQLIDDIFIEAHNLFNFLKEHYHDMPLDTLSMGMSHDYLIAIKEGSTMLRIGTILFEENGG